MPEERPDRIWIWLLGLAQRRFDAPPGLSYDAPMPCFTDIDSPIGLLRLVAEDGVHRQRPEAVHEMQVGVTDAGADGADEDLAGAGTHDVDVVDDEGLTGFLARRPRR